MKRKRYQVLEKLLKNRPHKVGCEVGVNTGVTTSYLLNKLPGIERYYAVDFWSSYYVKDVGMYNGPAKKAKGGPEATNRYWYNIIREFLEKTKKHCHKVVILRMASVKAVDHIEDESLDWVFIDAHHRSKFIRKNLEIWYPKVKIGGIVSGHDYGNPNEKKKGWGIKQEVDLFIGEDKLHVEDDYTYWFERE